MKKIVSAIFLGLFIASPVFADWIADFPATVEKKGIEVAVQQALEEGKTPADIIEEGLKLTELNPQNLLKALYCSGADGDDIKTAADANEISEMLVIAAFKKSLAGCGDKVVNNYAYTPATSYAGAPSPTGSNDSSYASPHNFQ